MKSPPPNSSGPRSAPFASSSADKSPKTGPQSPSWRKDKPASNRSRMSGCQETGQGRLTGKTGRRMTLLVAFDPIAVAGQRLIRLVPFLGPGGDRVLDGAGVQLLQDPADGRHSRRTTAAGAGNRLQTVVDRPDLLWVGLKQPVLLPNRRGQWDGARPACRPARRTEAGNGRGSRRSGGCKFSRPRSWFSLSRSKRVASPAVRNPCRVQACKGWIRI